MTSALPNPSPGDPILASHIDNIVSFLSGLVVNVKDQGAVGDGSTDDLSVIQASIDAAAAAGGGTVYLPVPAVGYRTTGAIALKAGVHVVGASRTAVKIQPSAQTFAAFTATGLITQWSVSNLTVDYSVATGSVAASNAAALGFSMLASGSDYPYFFEISHVSVLYAYRGFSQVTTARSFMYSLKHFYCSEIGEYGIVIKPTSGCTTVVLQNCYVNVAEKGGFDLSGIDSLTMLSCACDNVDASDTSINSLATCRGLISGFQAEGNTIPENNALLLLSGSLITLVAPKLVGNVYATGSGEAYGIRCSDSASVDIYNPLNSTETSTGTGTSFVVMAASNNTRCVVYGGGGVSAPTGTASDNGVYTANNKLSQWADDDLSLAAQLKFLTAITQVIPGATSLSFRNNADNADNLIITDAGAGTFRSTLTVLGASATIGTTPADAGAIRLANAVALNWRNAANSANLGFTLNSSNQMILTATNLQIGTNPASGGAIGIANNSFLLGRNAANSSNLTLIGLNTSDKVWIDANATGSLFGGEVEIDGALNHDGTTVGFFGVTPATRATTYSATNVTTDRAYDANSTTVDELADVLGTLIADLRTYGLVT